MTVNLNKETLKFSDIVYEKNGRTIADVSVNVPDINPDIRNILDVSGFTVITEKKLYKGKISVNGKATVTVLYSPDGEVISKIKSLTAEADFSYTADSGIADDSAQLIAEIESVSYNHNLLNSRKINLHCIINLRTSLSVSRITELSVSDSDDDNQIASNLRILPKRLRLCSDDILSENKFSIRSEIELSSDKPSVSEILKVSAIPQPSELIMTEGKACVKGRIKFCCIYTSIDDGEIAFAEKFLPFEETLDIPDVQEDTEGEVEYSLCDIYREIKEDSDGETRIIAVDIDLYATVRCRKISTPAIICDGYSLDYETEVASKTEILEHLIDNTTSQFTHKNTLTVPESAPEPIRICDAEVTAEITDLSTKGSDTNASFIKSSDLNASAGGEVTVNGVIHTKIIYLSQDEGQPLCTFTDAAPFTHTVTVNGISNNSICDAGIFVEHISYNMSGSRNIDARVVVGLSIKSLEKKEISVVSEIEVDDTVNPAPLPSVAIYFAQENDTLWSIAKKFRITTEKLKEDNKLARELTTVGQCFKIIR